MKRTMIALAVLATVPGVFSACKKKTTDNPIPAPVPTRTDSMVGNWNRTHYGVDGNFNKVWDDSEKRTDVPNTVTRILNSDHTGSYNIYYSSTTLTYTTVWTLINNDSIMRSIERRPIFPADTLYFKVLSLSANELIIADTSIGYSYEQFTK